MTIALIVAAGSGQRLGADRPKALVELCGRPMLHWSLAALIASERIERIVVALPPGCSAEEALGEYASAGRRHGYGAGSGPASHATRVTGVQGGSTRSDSVRRALAASAGADAHDHADVDAGAGAEAEIGASDEQQIVLVHDAARPLLSPAIVERVIDTLLADERADAAIAAAPVTDTIKRVGSEDEVIETLSRSSLWAVQTPQVFRRGALLRALDVSEQVLTEATDDAWLVERAGGRVLVAAIAEPNIKITTPLDLRLAADLLAARATERA